MVKFQVCNFRLWDWRKPIFALRFLPEQWFKNPEVLSQENRDWLGLVRGGKLQLREPFYPLLGGGWLKVPSGKQIKMGVCFCHCFGISDVHCVLVGCFRADDEHDGGHEMPLGQQPAPAAAPGHGGGREHQPEDKHRGACPQVWGEGFSEVYDWCAGLKRSKNFKPDDPGHYSTFFIWK